VRDANPHRFDLSSRTAQRSQRTTMIVAALLILCLVLAAVFDWMD